MGSHKSFHLPESRPHYKSQKDFHTEHVKIELALDFAKKSISGSCALTIGSIRPGTRTIRLDACGLDVSRVAVDGTPVEFEYDNDTLSVPLDGASPDRHLVEVKYSSVPKEGVYFAGPDKEHPGKEVQAWTHSETEFARYWYPCFDHPNEKSSSELVLTVPNGFRVISNGKLVSTTENGRTTTFHWKEELPHSSYLTSFVAGKFGQITQEADGVELHYNFPESRRKDVLRYFGETPPMMEVFGSLTGIKYPYAKYDQTTVEDFLFGAMENFNATTFAMHYYPDAASEEDFQTSYATPYSRPSNLVAHELAHQWFGDLVTCTDWSHAWLHEALATYFQALYLEKTRGVDEMRWDLSARAEEYFDEDEREYRRPIVDRNYVWPDDVFDYTTYEKGASMLHELRYVMRDEAFFAGIHEYLKSYSFANADSHDFLRSMEKASGLSLEEFFEQAFFKPGHPELEIDYAWDDEGKTATLHVRQAQKLEDGTPIFKLPCDIVFYVGDERRKRTLILDSPEQTLTFALHVRPSIVEFDPERWLLKKVKFDKSLDLLLNQLERSNDAWSRAEAAKSLGKLRSSKAVPGLKAAALREQFWDVNASALRALGEIGTEEALNALVEIGMPKNRRARRGLAEALSNFKDEKARALLLQLLKTDESPYVRCEAALSLAKSWPEGALPHLKKSMEVSSPNETLAEACLDAMGKLKDHEVDGIIRDSLKYGIPTRARIGALKAIKGRGHILSEEVPLLKDILLRDKEFRVRLYLVGDVIRHLSDKRFLEEVKESSRTDRDPRVRRRALETYYELSASAEVSTTVSKLKAEVEELKEENRRLARYQP